MNDAPHLPFRQDALRARLPEIADLLRGRRASEIGDAAIDALVALSWLDWAGGSLHLTTTGMNICRQEKLRRGQEEGTQA
jgi:hypothetical protein